MIITRTPFRISFSGGGSDISTFYRQHEGCVVSTTIDKYMYITIHPSFNHDLTAVKYSNIEIVKRVNELIHPVARQVLLDFGLKGVEITSSADVPSGTGLSTSSAYAVGLIHAVSAYLGKYYSQQKIAKLACEVEIDKLGEPIGKQDQYGTAVGGLKLIRFRSDETVDIEKLILSRDTFQRLNENLLLFFTGISHSAGEILEEQSRRVVTEKEKFNNMVKMTELAYATRDALIGGDLTTFGDILNESWQIKRKLTESISNPTIDATYDLAMRSGARGGKLLGAGGGGFLLFYCEKEHQMRLRSAMNKLVELPFNLENGGTKVIYVGDKDW